MTLIAQNIDLAIIVRTIRSITKAYMIQTEVDSDVTKSKSIYCPVYLNIFKK